MDLQELIVSSKTIYAVLQASACDLQDPKRSDCELGHLAKQYPPALCKHLGMKSLEGGSRKRHSAAGGSGKKHFNSTKVESDSKSNECSCVHSLCMSEETQQSEKVSLLPGPDGDKFEPTPDASPLTGQFAQRQTSSMLRSCSSSRSGGGGYKVRRTWS